MIQDVSSLTTAADRPVSATVTTVATNTSAISSLTSFVDLTMHFPKTALMSCTGPRREAPSRHTDITTRAQALVTLGERPWLEEGASRRGSVQDMAPTGQGRRRLQMTSSRCRRQQPIFSLTSAQDCEADRIIRYGSRQRPGDVAWLLDGFAVERQQDVAGQQARVSGDGC